jgi:hypothetical protein
MEILVRNHRIGWRRHIVDVLERWISIQHRFFHSTGELAYRCSERINVSLLAAATWQCNHIAIEEFAIRRGNGWRAPGRVDLVLKLGRTTLGVEAKVAWLALPHAAHEWQMFWRVVRAHIRSAQREAVRIARAAFQYRLGVVFCVLSAGLSETARFREEFVLSITRQAPQKPLDFLAAYLPLDTPPRRGSTAGYGGVILVGSATRR